jgi:hypothetical protein
MNHERSAGYQSCEFDAVALKNQRRHSLVQIFYRKFVVAKFISKINMRRAISLSFLMLANMFLLAHVVIPCRHDHDTIICACFLTDVHADCEKSHEHTHDADSQHHNDDFPTEECAADTDVYLYVRHTNIKPDVEFCLNRAVQYPVLFLFPMNPVVEITGLEGLPFRQKPYLPTCHTGYITRSLGLRAPPVC